MNVKNVFEIAAYYATHKALRHPDTARVLLHYFDQLAFDAYPQSYVDVIFQEEKRTVDMYDTFCFAKIHAGIREGLYGLFQIPVRSTPFPDKAVDLNNEILSNLSAPFHGEFWGGLTDHDGNIGWNYPVNISVGNGFNETSCGYAITVPTIDSNEYHWGFPLEVGYNSGAKLLACLNSGLGMARWPYGQKKITVLLSSRWFYFKGERRFSELKKAVWGNFNTFPNPYDEWNKYPSEYLEGRFWQESEDVSNLSNELTRVEETLL